MDWLGLMFLAGSVIALLLAIFWPGKLPEWQDLHGEEYLKWKRGEKGKSDNTD